MVRSIFTKEGLAALGKSIAAGAALAAAGAAISAEGYVPIGFLIGVPVIRGLGFIMYDPKHAREPGDTSQREFVEEPPKRTIH